MAPWHCPHCGALQPESARCWVCRRSSTTCSTCRNFQRSLATDVGFCSLDRQRRPLTGLELRGCWEGRGVVHVVAAPASGGESRPARPPMRGFVPLDEVGAAPAAPLEMPAMPFIEAREAPTSLFGEPER